MPKAQSPERAGENSAAKRPEVLAPAGSEEALTAAVRAGADAVYFGGRLFNARRSADNFDGEALARAVRFCHERGVKAYITVNTLLFGGELRQTLDFAEELCALGVDALIVQDLGLAAQLRRAAPELRLHASTQLSVHNAAGVEAAAECGFKRVVLARELSGEEIARIAERSPCELEVFVHGALCMSLSGQCYLSAMLGSRSGNRGLCAQPCRLPFSVPGGTGRDLSLKDCSLVGQVGALARMGVASLKIEGRMKRPEYVAAATAVCRDAAMGREVPPDALDRLHRVFSRGGFTDGYFAGKRGREMFGAREREDVAASQGVLRELHGLYREEFEGNPVSFSFALRADRPAVLTARDAGGRTARSEGLAPEPARSRATDEAFIREKLGKTGGTPFFAQKIEAAAEPGLALPAAELNRMKREALDALLSKRGEPVPVPFRREALTPPPKTVPKGRMEEIFRFYRASQLFAGAKSAAAVFLPVRALCGDLPGTRRLLEEGWPLGAELPRAVFHGEEELIGQLGRLKALGISRALCGNIGALRLAAQSGLRPFGDFGLNVANEYAFGQVLGLGAEGCVLSFEQTLPQMTETASPSPGRAAMLVYGFLPLMLTRNCPGKNGAGCANCFGKLTDRTGEDFPLLCGAGEYTELLNTRPLWMADRKREAGQTGAGYAVLYYTRETSAEAEAAAEAWRKSAPPPPLFTRGLYYRGVE